MSNKKGAVFLQPQNEKESFRKGFTNKHQHCLLTISSSLFIYYHIFLNHTIQFFSNGAKKMSFSIQKYNLLKQKLHFFRVCEICAQLSGLKQATHSNSCGLIEKY